MSRFHLFVLAIPLWAAAITSLRAVESPAVLCVNDGHSSAPGTAAFQRGEFGLAMQLYRPLADLGDPVAQTGIGKLYGGGRGVSQDSDLALYWYRKAAEGGDAVAQFQVAVAYWHGIGVQQSWVSAYRWLRKSANKSYYPAEHSLGILYSNGTGVKRNYRTAFFWFHRSILHRNIIVCDP